MRTVVFLLVLPFILLQSLSCVKKVTPSLEPSYLSFDSTNMYLYSGSPGGTVCKGLRLDGDTAADFSLCSYYYGGGQAKQSILYANTYNGVVLELDPSNSGLAPCASGELPLHFRKSGETVVTADTSRVARSGTYHYYVGAGTHGVALLGNCSFDEFRTDTLYYIVLRKIEGSSLSIGYLEVKKHKLTRFRKFRKDKQIVLP